MRIEYSLDTTPTTSHLDIVTTIVKAKLRVDDLDENTEPGRSLSKQEIYEKYILPDDNKDSFRNWLGPDQTEYILAKLVTDRYLTKVGSRFLMTDLCYWPNEVDFIYSMDEVLNLLKEVRCL